MTEDMITELFPELQKSYDHKAGVLGEYSSPQAARVHFARAMQVHGYRAGGNRTWSKPGFATVIESR